MKIDKVNIGLLIEQRLNELGMSKSEFGRRIGIPQQNVNRILAKSSIDTDKLLDICEALDYNFFESFNKEQNVIADNGSIAVTGNSTAHHINVNGVNNQDTIELLRASIADKERTIQVQQQLINELQKRK